MSDGQRTSPQEFQASVTAVLGGFVTASCLKWTPAEDAQYWAGAASLIVPIIGYLVAKWFSYIDEPDGLTRYKARLKRDLAHQKKMLKDKNVSSKVKEDIQKAYEATLVKLATANQDYTDQGLVVEEKM
ncbi:TPA: hypothetical protein NI869_005091 [Pseudomonas aeruginosa]|uniref:hypothetical protein n=1 Tax=Pseudomonas aeruginosa TaxID=287 RepID=UPI000F52B4CC|nr:hypothetical protein [Pseudomonas aeruginosa]HCE5541334.1 hypothetical protein [Pseudomonas aeruginosa]HCE5612539.1 hypothetical protein [Pseudomonas aeruginosa]HCE5709062.1 hypothetical protein [Pseudomonas aeruginosa]HCE5714046.1 hypothetical protein [Pseudomonas aeruginosa]HCE5911545.1 hypothetical protein [Pseudomonas aeruginosa]